jgi:hypothetical protein
MYCGSGIGLLSGLSPIPSRRPTRCETPVLRRYRSLLGRVGCQPTRPESRRVRSASDVARPRRRASASDGLRLSGAPGRVALLPVGDGETSLRPHPARLVRPAGCRSPRDARGGHSSAGRGWIVATADEERVMFGWSADDDRAVPQHRSDREIDRLPLPDEHLAGRCAAVAADRRRNNP